MIKMTRVMIGAKPRSRLHKRLMKLSIRINMLLGGEKDQTFSARNHERKRQGLPNVTWLIDLLLGENHCLLCWVNWKVRTRET